jgi:hypothetical protein
MAKKKHLVPWHQVDRYIAGLETTEHHCIEVQREAIPLVFLPGIMGTHLRRSGTDGTGKTDGVPNTRWNPSDTKWVLRRLVFANGADRRRLLIGEPHERFDPGYLEPDEAIPPGNGWKGVMEAYHVFLQRLHQNDWGALKKHFEFPVYALGFNWTADLKDAAPNTLKRIDDIIKEAKAVTGYCEKVILITHSMGGIMARSISELAGGRNRIAGIIHGVQPVNGAPAAYWRMKAGFEGFDKAGILQRALGNNGEKVTAVLGNIPGGLELLPNKVHRTNTGNAEWLTVTDDGKATLALPVKDPYQEIYRVPAEPIPNGKSAPSSNTYWGLVDPALLNPDRPKMEGGDEIDQLGKELDDDWTYYLKYLAMAEELHDGLNPPNAPPAQHPQTLCLAGTGHKTADVIELQIETRRLAWYPDPYPNQGFTGSFLNEDGDRRKAVLQDPAGDGDVTVVLSSGAGLNTDQRPHPGDRLENVEHQPAFESDAVQEWAIEAINGIVKHRFYEQRKASEEAE